MQSTLPNVVQQVDLLEDKAYSVLKQAIISLQLLPGEHLAEKRLSKELGISKTPIKYALVRLQRDGFVKQSPHRGVYVASVTTTNVLEISELRQALEGFAIRSLIRKRHHLDLAPAGLTELQHVCEGALNAVEDDELELFSDYNDTFHRYFIAATDNEKYLSTWNNINEHFRRLRAILNRSQIFNQGRWRIFAEQHITILRNVVGGDADQAAELMVDHIGSFAVWLNEEVQAGRVPLIEITHV